MLKRVGEYFVKALTDRVRGEGLGVKSPGGRTSKLAPLKKSYIEQRKHMRLHPQTTPSTSNLTQTGAMLDALFYKVEKERLIVNVRGRKNQNKAYWTNVFRPWVNLSNNEAKAIKKIVSEALDK